MLKIPGFRFYTENWVVGHQASTKHANEAAHNTSISLPSFQVTCLSASRTWTTPSCGRQPASGLSSRSRVALTFCVWRTTSFQATALCSRCPRSSASRSVWWCCARSTTWTAGGKGPAWPRFARSVSLWKLTEGGSSVGALRTAASFWEIETFYCIAPVRKTKRSASLFSAWGWGRITHS